jgi:hypothetical protein
VAQRKEQTSVKVTLESTSKIVGLVTPSGGTVPARLWEGTTELGIPVHAYITLIAARQGEDLSEFERELEEQRAPSADVEAIPARMIL